MRISDWSSDVCSSDLEAVGDLTPVSEIFDQVGFSIGERRFSLLTLLQIGITILALYAGVKLVNRLVGQSVKRASGLASTQQLLVKMLVAIGLVVLPFFVGIDLISDPRRVGNECVGRGRFRG